MKFSPRLALLLLLGNVCLAAQHHLVDPNITLVVNDGYCANGTMIPLVPSAEDPPHLKVWGGFCRADYKDTALAKTSPFRAPEFLRIYVIGWAKTPTFSLQLVSDGTKFLMVPFDENPGRWSLCDFRLPADWQGKEVRIIAEGAPERGLWRAFSEPIAGDGAVANGDALHLLGLTALHYCAFMLCALAVTALAVWRAGVRDRIQAGLITLMATAIPGYLLFWLTLWSEHLSRYFAVGLLAAAFVILLTCFRRLDNAGRTTLYSLRAPLLLTGAVALMVLSSGFVYGGWDNPMNTAQCRFLPRLPPDNEIPLLLAEGVRSAHVPRPLQGSWLSSDRPPLQSGIVLAHYPLFRKPRVQGYTAISVLAQSLWVFGLWLLLTTFNLDTRAVALTLTVCIFSGFAFLNTFFVWPKMLAAAYAFGFLAAFVALDLSSKESRFLAWFVPGVLFGCSLLAHGGTIFALLPAVPMVLLWKRPVPIKRMAAALVVAFFCYLPWMLYQRFYDPPGNHLMKIHLAGVEKMDNRSFGETLMTAYGALSWSQISSNKKQNLEFSFAEGLLALEETNQLVTAMLMPGGLPLAAQRGLRLREQMFFHPAPCLGLFIFAPFTLLAGFAKRFRSIEWRAACVFWVFTTAATIVWCVLMFGPSTTSIHQGAYATMLLAFAAGVLSLWAVSPWLAVAFTLVHVSIDFLTNELLIRVPFGGGQLPEGLLHTDTLFLWCVSLIAVWWLLAKLAQEKRADLLLSPPADDF